MSLPRLPGMSYQEMYRLILFNRVQLMKDAFSVELILAINWEETFFNNVKQTVGTGVGFGQIEPSEFWKITSTQASDRGYFVPGLPPRQKVGESTRLLGTLSDEQSIQVQTALLCQLYIDNNQSQTGALEAYAGVKFSRELDMSRGKVVDVRGTR